MKKSNGFGVSPGIQEKLSHFSLFPKAKTIIDVGGQDIKAIKVDTTGKTIDFVMNDKCAAGSGRFIEVIADTLGVPLDKVGDLSLGSKNPAKISNICTIWAQQEVAASLAQGIPVSDLLAGVHQSLAERINTMVNRLRVEKAKQNRTPLKTKERILEQIEIL